MRTMNNKPLRLVAMILVVLLAMSVSLAQATDVDYANKENWAYYGIGEGKAADLFLICPTVDLGEEGNHNMAMDDEKMRQKFVGALNMERGIYEDALTLYAPYYRQASLPVYYMDAEEAEAYFEIAYQDVRAAFLSFLEHTDENRPFVLAGFSQGADMVVRLMKDLFDDTALQKRLIASYCLGWRLTEEDVAEFPWLKPATGADDLGSIIMFSTEAEGAPTSIIVPEDVKTYSINPLNWRNDGEKADTTENIGACFPDGSGNITKEVPNLTGAYIEPERGVLIATDINPSDYTNDLFPDKVYHLYDYQFFYRDLQANVALRVDAYLR